MKQFLFGCYIIKEIRLSSWYLDQIEQILGSAPVKVMMVAYFKLKRTSFTSKSLTYLKPPRIQVRCLACQMQQIEMIGVEYHFFLAYLLSQGQICLRCIKGSRWMDLTYKAIIWLDNKSSDSLNLNNSIRVFFS